MFEGDFADTHNENIAHADGGPSRGSSVRRPGSEELHRRERIFSKVNTIKTRTVSSVSNSDCDLPGENSRNMKRR